MNKPTPLSPWFVITRWQTLGNLGEQSWLCEEEEDGGTLWTEDRTQARLFNSIHTAIRVAAACGAYAVVVGDEAAYEEYRPKQK